MFIQEAFQVTMATTGNVGHPDVYLKSKQTILWVNVLNFPVNGTV